MINANMGGVGVIMFHSANRLINKTMINENMKSKNTINRQE